MGNMLPSCLVVQQGTAAGALPAMNPKRRLISLNLLVKGIHRVKKMPAGPGKAPEIDSKKSSSSEALETARSNKAARSTNNPKGAVLRSRLHGRRSGAGLGKKAGKQGVVRVKVVLTKEEAARLLSLTVGGGQKHTTTAAQIVAEMRKMEARRRVAAGASWRPALASIPEESS
ncbi:uncharacterized protein LOC107546751 [Zea mays]|jgi:hypothetical protein|uniref:DUF7890 domain-containing protein n=1 Tax=Zea mays TaxID=4577 RepID=K7URD2_MAIZE|nr:uncharacterized protein LOC107546751 [Zea mays]AQK91060.1 hypothetical protein ZEAMMB73_Zm00001d008946 [Zea mays]|eukprot:NP_001309383.1 uncharacterized protein LOC107546751 [Zea mays]